MLFLSHDDGQVSFRDSPSNFYQNLKREFASKWGLGIGIYSEQGGESIHAEFNSLKRQYWQMHGTKRLQSMMKEHYIRNNPLAKKMKPAVKSRKRKVED